MLAKRPRFRDTQSWKEPFLVALRNCGNVRASAQAAKVSRATVYEAREAEPLFAALWDEAREEAVELLEAVCRRRAIKGSDILMMFLLKAARPDVYREQRDINVKGQLNQEIVVDLVSIGESND